MRSIFITAAAAFLALLGDVAHGETPAGIRALSISYEVLRELPHDATHYTQGLVVRDGRLFESSGRYAQSALYETDLRSSEVLRSYRLPDSVFGEGLAFVGDELHVLSWREQRAFVLSPTLELRRKLRYIGEGWGLASIGPQLVRSDGSDELRFLDPKDHQVMRVLPVRDADLAVDRLNELEYARGFILANIWYSDRVALIDPANGRVRAWLDLRALRARLDGETARAAEVLNGLAYDAGEDVLYVTGKLWPKTFALRVHWPATTPDPAR